MTRAALPLIVLAIVACAIGLIVQMSRSSASSEGGASMFTSGMIIGGLVAGAVGFILLLKSPKRGE